MDIAIDPNQRWTARFFILARPFVNFDPEGVFGQLAELLASELPQFRYALSGEKKSKLLKNWRHIAELSWNGNLAISGCTSDGIEFSASLWRHRRTKTYVSPEDAGYQCHEVVVDFPVERVQCIATSALAKRLGEIAKLSRCEFGAISPLRSSMIRQLYRERGLTEGIPGVFPAMILGDSFAAPVQVGQLRDRLGGASCFPMGGVLAIVTGPSLHCPLDETEQDQIKEAMGADLFAGRRELIREQSGVLGVFELLRLGWRNVAADREARQRSSKHDFRLDWEGVFEPIQQS